MRTVAALVAALALVASGAAASSRLGIVVVAVGPPGARSEAAAVAIQPNGRIVAGGDLASTSLSFALVRLKRSGAPDQRFGSRGTVTTSLGRLSGITSLAVQTDGKILAAGTGTPRVLARYLPGGSLDPSFGSGGVVTGVGGTLALQPDGRIVSATSDAVVRLLPGGSPDPSFGSGGTVKLPFGAATNVAVQGDGKIVAALSACGDFCEFAVARFTASGALDSSFGSGGLTARIDNFSTGLALAPDGAILVTGGLGSPALWRFLPNGSLATAFDTGAIAIGGVAVQRDGKIVLAGSHFQNLVLARYRPNGALDPTFGRDGVAETRGGHGAAVTIQPNGRIVVAGATTDPGQPSSFLVGRFTARGALDRTFGPGCTVPKVLGLSLVKAKARIVAAGCRAGAVVRRKSARPPGRVIGQKPKAGTRVELGSRVRLVVSR